MSNEEDYATWSLEALQTEEKKMKKSKTLSASLIGFAVGVMIFGVATNGFGFIYVFIPLVLIYWIYKNSETNKEKLAQIQMEIDAKEGSR